PRYAARRPRPADRAAPGRRARDAGDARGLAGLSRAELGHLERGAAVGALHVVVELDHRFANRTQDVGVDRRRGFVLAGLRLHLARHLAQVEGRRAAVHADVAGLGQAVVLVDPAGVERDLRKDGAEEPAAAL